MSEDLLDMKMITAGLRNQLELTAAKLKEVTEENERLRMVNDQLYATVDWQRQQMGHTKDKLQ
jgi:regulator of replication initiation timing